MKAIVYHNYGSADVLKYEEIPQPAPQDNEVLIRVRAAAANPLDWRFIKGEPRLLRLVARLMKVAGRPGVDVAGEVETVGKNVTQFKPGDKVFGASRGAFAEYACTKESGVTPKPDNVTFEQAASVNVAGLTALQGLRDKLKIQAGHTVLVNGAAGGVGTFAVQVAKIFGAQVTGVCSTRNLELVKSIGADEVIDYTQNDFAKGEKRYDLLFDSIGNRSLADCRRVLKPQGRAVFIGAPHDVGMLEILAVQIQALAISAFSNQKLINFVAKARQTDLAFMAELMKSGKLTPVIDRSYPLADAAEAIRYLEAGHACGKVIIDVDRAAEY
jgi:NADPH:quinone reductase-like Zn-dependent oxidoreductase